jgi:hypothetical protein
MQDDKGFFVRSTRNNAGRPALYNAKLPDGRAAMRLNVLISEDTAGKWAELKARLEYNERGAVTNADLLEHLVKTAQL